MSARRPVALVGLFAQRAKESPGRAEGVKGIKAKDSYLLSPYIVSVTPSELLVLFELTGLENL